MLSKDAFVTRILEGRGVGNASRGTSSAAKDALAGLITFEDAEGESTDHADTRFAQLLLEESGFGPGETVPRSELVLGDQKTNRFLPAGATYWAKTSQRPFHILLFELEAKGKAILANSFFRQGDQLEDSLHRIVQDALEGFERGGSDRTADRKQGIQSETLCVVSVVDDRTDGTARQIVCFGTKCVATEALEVFTLREEARDWAERGDRPLAEEHLGQLYERHFKRLSHGTRWQEAFISGIEHRKAAALMEACRTEDLTLEVEETLRERIRDLLDEIAWSFGVPRRKANFNRCLEMVELPPNHSIAADPDESRREGFENDFQGVRIYDTSERLLGFIVYFASGHSDLKFLRQGLKAHNHFHNVLVIYPDSENPELELWQGPEPLRGRLVSGSRRSRFDGEGGIVQLISRFFVLSNSAITKPLELAIELAWRARHLRALAIDELRKEEQIGSGPLKSLHDIFKRSLSDFDREQFADAYAQTVTYGMLASRWLSADVRGSCFSRKNVVDFLPVTSPLISFLFTRLVDSQFDKNLVWLLDDISSLLSRTLVKSVFHGEADPSIHFYEDFLEQYDPRLRAQRGVFYTPRPVVCYMVMVKGVHQIIQREYGLLDGLASTATWEDLQASNTGLGLSDNSHRDQRQFIDILDPAVGTGTYLVESIKFIEKYLKDHWCIDLAISDWTNPLIASRWSDYVSKYLLHRITGFEVMVASYVVAHIRVAFALKESGYIFQKNDRLGIYLTNTLEEPHPSQLGMTGILDPITAESQLVYQALNDRFFTVVLGNPPYSNYSANLSPYARSLVDKYRSYCGVPIRERNQLQFERNLQDDFVKFISVAQSLVLRSSIGVVALITNATALGSISLRGMRESLKKAFNIINVLHLHGGVNEIPSEVSRDDNIFDISQAVAIQFYCRSSGCQAIFYHDLWGERGFKQEWLTAMSLLDTEWSQIIPDKEISSFLPGGVSSDLISTRLNKAFIQYGAGIKTNQDSIAIAFSEAELMNRIRIHFPLLAADRNICIQSIRPILYRPFDHRYIFYHREVVKSLSYATMRNMMNGDNLALLASSTWTTPSRFSVGTTADMVEMKAGTHDRGTTLFPLFVYASEMGSMVKRSNIDTDFSQAWLDLTGIEIQKIYDISADESSVYHFIYYMYALFHSSLYRSGLASQLAQGFPLILYPARKALFFSLAQIGRRLTDLSINPLSRDVGITTFSGPSNRVIEGAWFSDNKIFYTRDKSAWVENVSNPIWETYLGGYQWCKKWFKDRKDRILNNEEKTSFCMTISLLNETINLVTVIDQSIDEYGGWPDAFKSKDSAFMPESSNPDNKPRSGPQPPSMHES